MELSELTELENRRSIPEVPQVPVPTTQERAADDKGVLL
jgi:hypothetical protein